MTRRRRRWLITLVGLYAVAVAGLCLALPGRPPGGPGARPASVPFEMLPSNHMIVQAKLNDRGPYWFIFDLGAPVTLVNNRAGEASGVVQKDAPRSLLFGMRGEAEVERLQLGELTAEDVPVIVLNHPALKVLSDALGRPIDGIIGYTFFARYKTTIDYQARTMTFAPVKFEVRNLVKDLPDRLLGPKVARRRVLAPAGLWGLVADEPPRDDLAAPGVPIREVLPGSPAAAAGLKPGDVLTSLDGRWTASVADTLAAAAAIPPGTTVPAVVLRDGKELTVMVTPKAGL